MRGNEMAGTMFLTAEERMIYTLAQEEQWDGECEAPCGAFVGFWLDSKEHNLIAAALGRDYGEVLKYWIVTEDNQGFLQFNGFENGANQEYHIRALESEYRQWYNSLDEADIWREATNEETQDWLSGYPTDKDFRETDNGLEVRP